MSFEFECATLRRKGKKLTTLLKLYQKYNPYLDEQVCLAHVIYTLISNGFMVSKSEIYYAFKKNYNRDFHGDVQSYVTWLYSLAQPSEKTPNNSISAQKQAQNKGFFDLNGLKGINTQKSKNEAQNNNILCRMEKHTAKQKSSISTRILHIKNPENRLILGGMQ